MSAGSAGGTTPGQGPNTPSATTVNRQNAVPPSFFAELRALQALGAAVVAAPDRAHPTSPSRVALKEAQRVYTAGVEAYLREAGIYSKKFTAFEIWGKMMIMLQREKVIAQRRLVELRYYQTGATLLPWNPLPGELVVEHPEQVTIQQQPGQTPGGTGDTGRGTGRGFVSQS
ncbi:MAG: hypothetical protein M1816_004799 [Peltula sp. TS41687]|nr:MAG: hypothetical protein M1816_004799 [Peltula sp. TS41687]